MLEMKQRALLKTSFDVNVLVNVNLNYFKENVLFKSQL